MRYLYVCVCVAVCSCVYGVVEILSGKFVKFCKPVYCIKLQVRRFGVVVIMMYDRSPKNVKKCSSRKKTSRRLCDKVERAIEAALAIHILAILALEDHMHFADIVALDFLVLGGVKCAEAHCLEHLNLFRRFTLQIGFINLRTFRSCSCTRIVACGATRR